MVPKKWCSISKRAQKPFDYIAFDNIAFDNVAFGNIAFDNIAL